MPIPPARPLLRPLLLAGLLALGGLGHAAAGSSGPGSSGLSSSGPGSYTVQPGDTAYSVARAAGLSVPALLALNGLTGSDLKVGQVIRLSSLSGPPAAPAVTAPTATHTVQPGETAYSVAREAGLSVPELLALNNLSASDLKVGQVLRLTPGSAAPAASAVQAVSPARAPAAPHPAPALTSARPLEEASMQPPVTFTAGTVLPAMTQPAQTAPEGLSAAPTASPSDWRGAALSLLGIPYVYGGSTRSGLDCSGFVSLAFAGLSLHLPRQSAEQARAGTAVDLTDLRAGDLLFFDTEGQGQVTHVGIYLGGGTFIHANSYAGKVSVSRVDERYYAARLLSARRVLPPSAQFP